MALHKIRAITAKQPGDTFREQVAREETLPPRERRYSVHHQLRTAGSVSVSSTRIATIKEEGPQFFVQTNVAGDKTVLEFNPGELENGHAGVEPLVFQVFGCIPSDLKINRIDAKGDLPRPVAELFEMMRVPKKQKGTHYSNVQSGSLKASLHSQLTGFSYGHSHHLIRVYDKKTQLKKRGVETSNLPEYVTRIEVQFRHNRCPIRRFNDLRCLLKFDPFKDIQFLGQPLF